MIFADTHVLAWLASGDKRLPVEPRERLFDQGFFISAATAFEYADLHKRGRLPANAPLSRLLTEFETDVIDLPAITWTVAPELPAIHRDPVDRMLIAHALIAGATIASADRHIRRYPVKLLW